MKAGFVAAIVTTFILWVGYDVRPARADESDRARLDRLERVLEAQAQEIQRLRTERTAATSAPLEPAPSAIPSVDAADVARAFDATTRPVERRRLARQVSPFARGTAGVRWGGYLTVEYIAPSDRNSWFDLHRFVLQADAVIARGIDLITEIEFEHGGVGGAQDGDVEVEYLEIAFRLCDAFQPKLGAILIPFGRYNLYHDDPLNDFTRRPFVARYLMPTGISQPGIGAEGAFSLPCDAVLSYDVALTTGFDDGFSSSSGARGARQSWRGDNNENKQVWGRAALTLGRGVFDFLEVGVSGTYGRYDDADDQNLFGYGGDLFARKGPFELKAEYLAYDLERDPAAPAEDPRALAAAWVEAAYHFFPPGLGRCPNILVRDTSVFTLAVRWQWQDLNDRIHGAAFRDDLRALGVALNYRITERTVFRVDHTWFDAAIGKDQTEFTASFSTYF